MNKRIPNPVIAKIIEIFSQRYSHRDLNLFFLKTNATWRCDQGSKAYRIEEWFVECNNSVHNPLDFLGLFLEDFMERDFPDNFSYKDSQEKLNLEREDLKNILKKYGLQYLQGGIITSFDPASATLALDAALDKQSYEALKKEIDRALKQAETDPSAALTAASASIESFCKIYLQKNGIPLPKDQTIKPLWAEVSKSLGFDPARLEDNDLKKILGGLSSICDGIGALRTHAGSAHGRGMLAYNVEPRHARLAIYAAHTLILFALETSEKRKSIKK